MKDLIERSYEAIKKRGLINKKTKPLDFCKKISEEYIEFVLAGKFESKEREIEECIDFITAGVMYLHHFGYDFVKEFEKVVIKNEARED